MLTISNSALKTAKSLNCSFVVFIKENPTCCCSGPVKTLAIKLCKNFTDSNNIYSLFHYEGIDVYISKSLKLKNNIEIYQKLNLPIIGPLFGVKGIQFNVY
ncbi:MAG: hypothetical protein ACFWTK_08360 [Clostridium sp.]|jgi:uncharacterized protein YbbK (DUF523 family)